MAGSLSDYAEAKILDHLVGKTSWTMPASVYIALYTALPGDASASGTEVASSNNYSRKLTAGADWASATSGAGTSSNATVITFATPSGSWGTVVGFALYDAATVGNELAWADLTVSQAVGTGNTVSFAIGALTLSLS
jgi:hypothetical protein